MGNIRYGLIPPVTKERACYKRACMQPGIPHKIGYLKDTLYETIHIDWKTFFLLSYLYANNIGTNEEMARTCEIDKDTASQHCE